MKKRSRRDFIKISAIGAGGVVLAGSLLRQFVLKNDPLQGESIDPKYISGRFPTYCEICFWKCAGWVYTDEKGRIWKVTGNDSDPHCNGRLCPRGTGGIGMYYDNERLKTPLIRTEARGKQVFREASWDEALDHIAVKLKEIAEKYGPETVALFTHGTGGKLLSTLLKAYGSDSIAAPSYAQCKGPREAGFTYTFGESLESPEPLDIRDTRCLVLIGSHLGENMHNGQVQEMSDAIDKGTVIITVDPRFSIAANKSKYWLPIKPATDMALLLSWMHVLIQNGWYDKDYVEKYTTGFDRLRDHVRTFTPEWAYGITGIEPSVIRKTAREMFNASPSVIIHPGRHVTWYGDDTQRSRAIAILNALLGSWGRRGGFYRPEAADIPEFPHPEFPKPKKSWRDAMGGMYAAADLPLANAIIDNSIPEKAKDLLYKGWIVYGSNLIFTIPDIQNTIRAIQNLELLVAIDTMPMEITGWADVVLPECTYMERYDILRNDHHREPNIALRMPAADPRFNSKPSWWMTLELAKRMGLKDYFPWDNIEEFLDWKLKRMGTSLTEMQQSGVKKFSRTTSLYFDAISDPEFYTESGKIELYSASFEAMGHDPLPRYTHHGEAPEGFFRLIYGRAPMHTFSRTANNPNLTDLMDENTLWVNPRPAKRLGLSTGQMVWLKNQDGVVTSHPIKVRITERIRWDSVYMVHGFGHQQKQMKRCYGRGASDSELITRIMTDTVIGATGMRNNYVTILTSTEDVS